MKILTVKNLGIVSLVISSIFLCSCRDDDANTKISQLETELTAQREAQAKFVAWVASRDQQVNKQITYMADEVYKKFFGENYAVIDPNGQGFAKIESNNGMFLASCKAAEPYLDGHKLTLNIGNPYYMKYSGFTMKVRFGTRPPDYLKEPTPEQTTQWQKKYNEWEKSLTYKELNFTDELLPGTWTKVEMILAPSKPDEVAYISVSMKTDQVSLLKSKE